MEVRVLSSSQISPKTGHCGICAIIFLYEGSKAEIFIEKIQNPEEHRHKISDLGSQHFRRYDLWKLGIFVGS